VRSRIALRILAFNCLLVFLPVAAFTFLGSYERGLVDSLEQALSQQARITAAWLGSEASAAPAKAFLDARAAKRAIAAIGARRTARFRVVDSGGRLLADSSDIESAAAPAETGYREANLDESGEPFLYRLFSMPARAYRRFFAPPAAPIASADFYAQSGPVLLGDEIKNALAGRYGAATRVSSGGQVSVTLYSAVPVYSGSSVVGAVLVSQSTYRILRDLYAIRLDIGRIFLGSLAVAAALSMLLALTIVSPLRRLARAAAAALGPLSRPGDSVAAAFPESRRRDEVGELELALRSLALRLDERAAQTERFASDAAHEFRNPLAAIRSAAELAEGSSDPAAVSRFHRAIIEDADRLRSIVDGLRRLSLAEGATDLAVREAVDADAAVDAALARAGERRAIEVMRRGASEPLPEIALARAETSRGLKAAVEPAALELILDNLVGNAVSFARSEVRVSVSGREAGKGVRGLVEIEIEDDGPGIPSEHLGRVFDRFFTYRPGEDRAHHTGLGLSLALALARAQGGSLAADNRPGGGARFVLTLPAAR
jgi:two-component system sensor histidine kinase ChvG